MRFTTQKPSPPEPDYGPRPLIDREELSWVVQTIGGAIALAGLSAGVGICAGIAVVAFRFVTGV